LTIDPLSLSWFQLPMFPMVWGAEPF
jgi:hypothetical protein